MVYLGENDATALDLPRDQDSSRGRFVSLGNFQKLRLREKRRVYKGRGQRIAHVDGGASGELTRRSERAVSLEEDSPVLHPLLELVLRIAGGHEEGVLTPSRRRGMADPTYKGWSSTWLTAGMTVQAPSRC